MSDLSSSAALLLQISGVLYGLLLAYYAFSLERVMGDIRENRSRLAKWMSGSSDSSDPAPNLEGMISYAVGDRSVFARRRKMAGLLCGSSILFATLVSIAGLELIDLFPKGVGDSIVAAGSFFILVGVPAVFAGATFLEYTHTGRQISDRRTQILQAAEVLLREDNTQLEKFRSWWKRY